MCRKTLAITTVISCVTYLKKAKARNSIVITKVDLFFLSLEFLIYGDLWVLFYFSFGQVTTCEFESWDQYNRPTLLVLFFCRDFLIYVMIEIASKLRNCPEGTRLWTEMFGEVSLVEVSLEGIITVRSKNDGDWTFDSRGRYCPEGDCVLWPASGESWEDFTGNLLWNPKNLKPYDKVLVLHDKVWVPELLSGYRDGKFYLVGYKYQDFQKVIPYCDETKDLAWTSDIPGLGWKSW